MDTKNISRIRFGFCTLHLVTEIIYCFSIVYATLYIIPGYFYVSLVMSASLFVSDYVVSLTLIKNSIWRKIENTIIALYITDILLIIAALLPVISFYWPETGLTERIPELILIIAMIVFDIIKKIRLSKTSKSSVNEQAGI